MLIGAYSALATLCKSQPTEAEIYAKTAIDLMKSHETDTEKFLSVYLVLQEMGKSDGILEELEGEIEEIRLVKGENSAELVSKYTAMAGIYCSQGRWKQGLAVLTSALSISQGVEGTEPHNHLIFNIDIGLSCLREGNLPEAQQSLNYALKDWRTVQETSPIASSLLAGDNRYLLLAFLQLAQKYQEQGEFVLALAALEKIAEFWLTSDTWDILLLSAFSEVATACTPQSPSSSLEGAIHRFTELHIAVDNQFPLLWCVLLAGISLLQRQLPIAEALSQKVCTLLETSQLAGWSHACCLLATVLAAQQKLASALSSWQRVHRNIHSVRVCLSVLLTQAYVSRGELEAAWSVAYSPGSMEQNFAQFYTRFGGTCVLESQCQTGIQCFNWSRVVFEKLQVPYADNYGCLAWANYRLGQVSAAECYSREALEIALVQFGSESAEMAEFYFTLGLMCRYVGKTEEAKERHLAAIAVLERHPSEGNAKQALMYRQQFASLYLQEIE